MKVQGLIREFKQDRDAMGVHAQAIVRSISRIGAQIQLIDLVLPHAMR